MQTIQISNLLSLTKGLTFLDAFARVVYVLPLRAMF